MRVSLSAVMILATLAMAGIIVYMGVFMNSLLGEYAAFLSFILMLLIIGILIAKFEESKLTSKEVALIGILAAITAASRIPFAALPNIQPCTFLIIVTGLVFGKLPGGMVGAMTAALSNLFFGQGPWTAWEMVSWGMVGIVSGYIGQKLSTITVKDIMILGIVLGLAYNTLMDFSSWITFYRGEPGLFIPTFAAGLPFGALHVMGNTIFAVLLGKPVLALYQRFKRRSHITYEPDRPPGPLDADQAS